MVGLQHERQTISQLEEYAHKSALENNFENPTVLAEISKGLGGAMKGIDIRSLTEKEILQARGW